MIRTFIIFPHVNIFIDVSILWWPVNQFPATDSLKVVYTCTTNYHAHLGTGLEYKNVFM